jgi:hypothetical protein
LQRLALRTRGWFAVVTAGLAGNAVTNGLPGGDAAGAAVQFNMLTTAGFDTDTAVGGLTTFSLLGVGGLLALPVFVLPAIVAGVPVSRGLVHTALLGLAGFALYAVCGAILLRTDRRPGHPGLPDRLLLAPLAGRTPGLPALSPPLRTPSPPARHAGRGRLAVIERPG